MRWEVQLKIPSANWTLEECFSKPRKGLERTMNLFGGRGGREGREGEGEGGREGTMNLLCH